MRAIDFTPDGQGGLIFNPSRETQPRTEPGNAHESTPTGLNSLASEIHLNAVNHGWWGDPDSKTPILDGNRNFSEVLALIHSEVSEALEAYRDGMPLNVQFSQHKDGLVCHNNEQCRSLKGTSDETKPVGVPSEMADIIIRVLDACAAYGIDIEVAMKAKMDYNRTRPYRHGGKLA